jgi:hypothetical protein
VKHTLLIDGLELRFSNPSEGFDLGILDNTTDEHRAGLLLRPDDGLADFVSAVADYSHDNGLDEVRDHDLKKMEKALRLALQATQKELFSRSKDLSKKVHEQSSEGQTWRPGES